MASLGIESTSIAMVGTALFYWKGLTVLIKAAFMLTHCRFKHLETGAALHSHMHSCACRQSSLSQLCCCHRASTTDEGGFFQLQHFTRLAGARQMCCQDVYWR